MKKYYDNLDDYYDTSRSPLLDGWKWLMPRLIAVAAIVMVLAYCAVLEAIK